MERRLQERCAELQREVFRLQGAHNNDGYKTLEKRPVALPRQVPPQSSKNGSTEHEDEGISSSETGQSLSPEPNIALPQNNTKKYTLKLNTGIDYNNKDDETNTTIEDVIEELENIVHDAEREIRNKAIKESKLSEIQLRPDNIEKEIVPVNLLPQPPKKSRSLSHSLLSGSDFEGSDYGMFIPHTENRTFYYDDMDFELDNGKYANGMCRNDDTDANPDLINQTSTNREILNVIMDAREKDENFYKARIIKSERSISITQQAMQAAAPQKFNGVFFMTEMSTPQKYPKPDITAALEARRVTKSAELYGRNGIDSMIDIIMTTEKQQQSKTSSNNKVKHITPRGITINNSTFMMRNKSPTPDNSNKIIFSGDGSQKGRTSYKNNNSGIKLTDLPSGLY